jgi:hypothetical protein
VDRAWSDLDAALNEAAEALRPHHQTRSERAAASQHIRELVRSLLRRPLSPGDEARVLRRIRERKDAWEIVEELQSGEDRSRGDALDAARVVLAGASTAIPVYGLTTGLDVAAALDRPRQRRELARQARLPELARTD